MKAHDLAVMLLKGPNLEVIMPGIGSDEGYDFVVTDLEYPGPQWEGENRYVTFSYSGKFPGIKDNPFRAHEKPTP